MFWGDKVTDEFLEKYGDEAKKRTLILRDEKTLSGRPHVGSLRSFVMHATISDVLTSRNIDHKFYYEINDTDAYDAVVPYVPKEWKEHLGKRLCDVPSPDGKASSYAEYFAKEYTDMLVDAGYTVEFYVSSDKYNAGEYDKYIRLALDNKDQIRAIYKEVSGSIKDETWYPCQVICDKCNKIATTKILSWDDEEVEYLCSAENGCGHKGKKSPFGGNATLPWKVEWAAKFCVLEVDLEGAGKDHYAAGGSRHVSNKICRDIFDRKSPFDLRHEFILLDNGGKMSSSEGNGATAVEVYELLPKYIFRFMMIQKDIMKTITFSPSGNTVPVLFDQYDQVCKAYFGHSEGEAYEHKNRMFELAHYNEDSLEKLDRFLPRFSELVFYIQVPHLDIEKKIEELKGSPLTEADKKELTTRIEYAKRWLELWSPEKYIFKIQEEVPKKAYDLAERQKDFLSKLLEFLEGKPSASGEEIQNCIYEIKNELDLKPAMVFEAIYMSILGRTEGPKAGWLLESLDNSFLINRFKEITK